MADAFAENETIIFLVLLGNNRCYCAVHLFRPFLTTSMFVWLPVTALVTTALCWLPWRCWSYSEYSLEICYATECFGIEGGTLILGNSGIWYLVSGTWFWDLELIVGIWNSVWGFRKCLESLWHCNSTSRSLRREDIDFTGRMLIAQGGYWLCIWMKSVVSRRIEHRAGRMLIVLDKCKIRRRCQFRIIMELQR